MNYDDLLASAPLRIYAQNRDVVANMDDILNRAHRYVVERIDHDAFQTTLPVKNIDTTGALALSTLPRGLFEIRSVRARWRSGDRWLPLARRNEEMLSTLYAMNPKGTPRHYTVTDTDLLVYPRPSRPMDLKITANVNPTPISSTNKTNVLTDDFPLVLENATAREAAIFQLDAKGKAEYSEELDAALMAANAQIARRKRDEVTQRPTETRNVMGQ